MPSRPQSFNPCKKIRRVGGSATLRDNTAAYARVRLAMLDAEPLCRYCRARGHITAAIVADHIIALSLGGSNDPSNLAPACKGCNDAKAKDEAAYLRKGYDLGSVRFDPALSMWIRIGAAGIR